jgi:hypothetical protein
VNPQRPASPRCHRRRSAYGQRNRESSVRSHCRPGAGPSTERIRGSSERDRTATTSFPRDGSQRNTDPGRQRQQVRSGPRHSRRRRRKRTHPQRNPGWMTCLPRDRPKLDPGRRRRRATHPRTGRPGRNCRSSRNSGRRRRRATHPRTGRPGRNCRSSRNPGRKPGATTTPPPSWLPAIPGPGTDRRLRSHWDRLRPVRKDQPWRLKRLHRCGSAG